MRATWSAVLALAIVAGGIVAAYEMGREREKSCQISPIQPPAPSAPFVPLSSTRQSPQNRQAMAAYAQAVMAEARAIRDASPAPKMYDALAIHFIPYEAERLTALYAEVKDRTPQDVADVRARAADIIGTDGVKRLIELSSIPKDLTTDFERMEYTFGNPLVWWSALQE